MQTLSVGSTVGELRRERDAAYDEASRLCSLASADSRDLTSEEGARFTALTAKVESLDRRIERMGDLEKLSAPGKRISTPPRIGGSYSRAREGVTEFKSLRGSRPVLGFRGNASVGEYLCEGLDGRGEVFSRPGALGRYLQFVACPSRDHAMAFLTNDERRLYFESTAPNTSGGYLVPESYLSGYFIDRLRARMVTTQAGAITIPLESDSNRIGRLATAPSFAIHGENVSESTTACVFDAITLTPRTLMAVLRLSDEWLQDAVNGAQLIEDILIQEMAVELDRLALVGGLLSTPTGVVSLAGNSVTQAPGTMDYDDLLDAIAAIQADNGQPTSWVLSSATNTVLAKLKKNAEANNYSDPPPDVAALKKFVTEAITASYVIVADFSHFIWGVRQDVQIKREGDVARNSQLISCSMRVDFNVTQPNAFCKISA